MGKTVKTLAPCGDHRASARRTVAPFVALVVLMLTWAIGGLYAVASETDRSDATRARDAVSRVVAQKIREVGELAGMNSGTNAALALGGPVIDKAWAYANYNVNVAGTVGYYGLIVLDNDGRPLVATLHGMPWSGPAMEAAARLAAPIASRLPRFGRASTQALIRDSQGHILVLGAANIAKQAGEGPPVPWTLPCRRLTFVHPVEPLVASVGPLLGARHFRIDPAATGLNTARFAIAGGSPLVFAWQPRAPGRAAVQRWSPLMAGALALATLLLGIAVRRSLAATRSLRDLAERDQLTGLPNRACLLAEIERRLARAPTFALGLMDLNGFKAVNDTHGHLAGDDLLRAFAAEARGATTPGEMIARLGGDEFAFIGASLADAERFAAELHERLQRPLDVGGLKLTIGSGIGIAVARPGMSARDLIALADARLYRDKAERKRVAHSVVAVERLSVVAVA